MGRAAKASGFYAVKAGRVPGVYDTWRCEAQIKGFSAAKYKKFSTRSEAEIFAFGQSSTTTNASTSPVTGASKSPTSMRTKPYDRPVSTMTANNSPERMQRRQRILEALAMVAAEWIEVYTDGACRGNGKAGSTAGVGVWFGPGHTKNLSERCPGVQTNNRAELIAIIRALEMTPRAQKPIYITHFWPLTLLGVESWLWKWKANNFQTANNKPVMNASLIMYLDALLSAKAPGTVKLVHVKAHIGLEGNEGADSLAGEGCTKPWREEYPGEWDISKVEGRDGSQAPAKKIDIEVSIRPRQVVGFKLPPPPFLMAFLVSKIDPNDILSAEELAEMERTQNFDS
ncbi:hypothetical protein BS47DRAFT_1324331 [Hydnum rufescens UP504]|uniref:Ribonuclease H n=1 Tax=Hydnum rufescens UP504 TaxID=1448309 RepID=A0A9P6DYM0_9AGAM|nr:hypothetical protein BS47DRAFT_1324331 [Hydnum rufescens UP504]